jgi:hypothetical protein
VQRELPGGWHVRHQLRAVHALRRLRLLPLLPGRAAGRDQLHLRAAGAGHMQQAAQLDHAVWEDHRARARLNSSMPQYLTDCCLGPPSCGSGPCRPACPGQPVSFKCLQRTMHNAARPAECEHMCMAVSGTCYVQCVLPAGEAVRPPPRHVSMKVPGSNAFLTYLT